MLLYKCSDAMYRKVIPLALGTYPLPAKFCIIMFKALIFCLHTGSFKEQISGEVDFNLKDKGIDGNKFVRYHIITRKYCRL